jgi:hypothetical protein
MTKNIYMAWVTGLRLVKTKNRQNYHRLLMGSLPLRIIINASATIKTFFLDGHLQRNLNFRDSIYAVLSGHPNTPLYQNICHC